MNEPNPEALKELKKRYEQIQAIRKSRRTQEEIIKELSSLINDFQKDSFLPYLTQMTIHIDQRETSEVFKNLMSPMKQFVYLTDLYFSVETGGNKIGFSEDEWGKITYLLNEIEMTYFGDIGFYDEDIKDSPNLDKVSVSLQTFLNYFGNAQLSYDEQTLERLKINCGAFDKEVKKHLGFSVTESITFCAHIKNLINKKFTDCNYYFLNKEEWTKLTDKFIERGVTDPREWWNEPELNLLKEYRFKPGFIFIQNIDDINKVNLTSNVIKSLIDFLTYNENQNKGKVVYYADKNPFFDTPLIKLNETEFLCPQYKFLIESFYNRINSKLAKIKKEKYTQFKNQMLEKKVEEVFRKLFGKEALIFDSYYVDKKKSEQDLLIVFKGFFFIIEIKDTLFRAPMRDPIKAFDKIKSDFKKSIQYGYEQCVRVESKFEDEKPFDIFDNKTHKSLFQVKPNKVKDYFSIIVTQFKYGNIQTNLDNLLKEEEDALYPWSICIDDLEAFILALKKLKKGMAKTQFINYLKHREAYNEHLICGDELELCGYFINSPKDFEKFSTIEETFNADPRMSELFDAEYYNGLGFKNEIDIDIKKYRKVRNYQKKWEFDIVSGKDFIDE
jgi:ribosomal protein S21